MASISTSTFKTVGQKYGDFEVTKISEISELHCRLVELVHLPSGAQVLSIENDDPENLFCLSFQTIPDSSNGVAHILEHTVLCGSKKYPVKDPFFAMQWRSLNTFMNALTGADFTCYPAASQVPKDFYNLLEVYLDAVFHPNLDELSFLQEGHRLEFTDPSDGDSPLEYKGIVFNEMKGAMSSPNSRLSEIISRNLMPDLTYGVNSGGDPKEIPTLTYQQLKEFHQKYYHPSQCLFFFYGNLPLQGHLDFIEKNILAGVKPSQPLPPLPMQPRFQEPRRIVEKYPIAADEDPKDKSIIAFAWLTCHILEQQELLALTIIEIILLDTDASPLKMALLKSGLCKQVSCYLEDEITEIPFVITLKGCNPESVDQIEELIKETLKNITQEGIPLALFDIAMHQLEFHRSEITGDGSPFGLSLFMRSALIKQHGGDATSGLHIHTLFEEIRRRNLEDPHYLTGLIEKYLVGNNHFVRVVMVPDKELANEEFIEEKKALEAIRIQLNEKERASINKKAEELAEFQKRQEEEEDVDVLPKISLKDDVSLTPRLYPLEQENIGNIQVFRHCCFTNEIIYADIVFNLPAFDEKELPFVRLMTTLLGQMGCGERDYVQNLDYIQANTGGITAYLSLTTKSQDHKIFYPTLSIRGKSLHRKASQLFNLLRETATSTDFSDKKRIKEIILKQYTGLQSSLNQNALKYAINLACSGLDVHSKIINDLYGLEYFWMMKELAENFDDQIETLIAKLKTLQKKIFSENTPDLVITCDSQMYDQLKGNQFYGLGSLSSGITAKWQPDYPLVPCKSQGRIITSPVAFNTKVVRAVSYTDPDASALSIGAFIADNLTLHTALREQGGAYGGGAINNPMSGNFYFYSYRDPHIVSSFKSFDHSIEKIASGDFDEEDIEEAKIEMMQALDSPVAPGSRGSVAYNWIQEGKSVEVRQAFRSRVLSLTSKDIVAAIKKWIVPQLNSSIDVTFAGKELLDKENEKRVSLGKAPVPIEKI